MSSMSEAGGGERILVLMRENRFLRDTLKIIAQGDLNADACWTIAAGALDHVLVHSPAPPAGASGASGASGAYITTERGSLIQTEKGNKDIIT